MLRTFSIDDLCVLRRATSGRVGLTSGVFDLFHVGHHNYLSICKSDCEFLMVGVDSDELVREKKGDTRPVETVERRLDIVIASGLPHALFIKESSMDELLKQLKPNVCFVSVKQHIRDSRLTLLRDRGIPLVPIPYTEGVSTTQILSGCHAEPSRNQPPIGRSESDRSQG